DQARVRRGMSRHVVGVVRNEAVEQGRKLFLCQRMSPKAAGPLDHDLGAMSDEMREVVVADRRHTDGRDRIIQALNKIGVSIEQCSVKIEYNKGRGQGLRLSEMVSSAVGDEDGKSNICPQRRRVANAHGFSKSLRYFGFRLASEPCKQHIQRNNRSQ